MNPQQFRHHGLTGVWTGHDTNFVEPNISPNFLDFSKYQKEIFLLLSFHNSSTMFPPNMITMSNLRPPPLFYCMSNLLLDACPKIGSLNWCFKRAEEELLSKVFWPHRFIEVSFINNAWKTVERSGLFVWRAIHRFRYSHFYVWVNEIFQRLSQYGEVHHLLRLKDGHCQRYFGLSVTQFDNLLVPHYSEEGKKIIVGPFYYNFLNAVWKNFMKFGRRTIRFSSMLVVASTHQSLRQHLKGLISWHDASSMPKFRYLKFENFALQHLKRAAAGSPKSSAGPLIASLHWPKTETRHLPCTNRIRFERSFTV